MAFHKGIIPAAGVGKRLRPITNVIPKEMFPVGRHPAIEWVVAEAVACGCSEIAVVISPRKQGIRQYLEEHSTIPPNLCNLTFIIQPEPLGLGHALTLTKAFSAGQPVALFLPDNLLTGVKPPLLQMEDAFARLGGAVFALTPDDSTEGEPRWSDRWNLTKAEERIFEIQPLVNEKPSHHNAIALAGVGRYLLTPECLEHAKVLFEKYQRCPLEDADIFEYMHTINEPVHGYCIEGRRFDISKAEGYIAAWHVLGKSEPVSLFS